MVLSCPSFQRACDARLRASSEGSCEIGIGHDANVPTAAAASTAASSSAVKAVSAVASVEISPKDIDQLVKDMIAATHKLVRSQMTWFR